MIQTITKPAGVTVFGSYIIRAEPDFASLKLRVTRTASTPAEAFASARDAARGVRAFVIGAKVPERDIQAGQLTLEEAREYEGGQHKLLGYRAVIGFHVLLRPFDNLDQILSGVVNAGVDRVDNVDLKTSRLREIRSDARGHSLENARAKAEAYASVAGVKLGKVLHIEDVNPEMTRGHASSYVPDAEWSEPGDKAQSPTSVLVTAAVLACFALIP